MKALDIIAPVCIAVSLIVILLCTSIILPTFSVSFYMNEYKKYSLSERIAVSNDDLLTVTKNLQRYMRGADPALDAEVYVRGVMRKFFNAKEISHMEDVKGLFDAGFTYLWAAVAVFAVSFAYTVKKKLYYMMFKYVAVGIGVFFMVSAALAAVCALNFDRTFVLFHEIFFNNDLWLLDPTTDLLVNLVPLEFFMDIARTIILIFFGSMAAVCIFCAGSAAKLKKRRLNAKA